jgi:hypothetical protein
MLAEARDHDTGALCGCYIDLRFGYGAMNVTGPHGPWPNQRFANMHNSVGTNEARIYN